MIAISTKLRSGLTALFAGTLIAFLGHWIGQETRIIRNVSSSHESRYFLVLRHRTPHVGDLVLAESAFINGKIIKKVLARGNTAVFLNQFVFQHETRDGRKLNPIAGSFVTIPDGFCFLHSPHPKSLDSRYREIGLVKETDLLGVAYPLPFGKITEPSI